MPLPVSPTMMVVACRSTRYRMALRYLYTGSRCLSLSKDAYPNLPPSTAEAAASSHKFRNLK